MAFIPDNISVHVHLLEDNDPDKTKTKMAAVSSLIFHKNNKSVSAKIITGRFCRQRKVKTLSSCGTHFRSEDNIFFFSNCNDNSVHHSKDAFVLTFKQISWPIT